MSDVRIRIRVSPQRYPKSLKITRPFRGWHWRSNRYWSSRSSQLEARSFNSNRLNVVTVNPHRHRSLDRVNGNNQAVIPVFRQKHTLDSVHRPTVTVPAAPPSEMDKNARARTA